MFKSHLLRATGAATEDGGSTTATVPAKTSVTTPTLLGTADVDDALAFIPDLPAHLQPKPKAEVRSAKGEEPTAEEKNNAGGRGTKADGGEGAAATDEKAEKGGEGAAATKKPEFTEDQQAWLDLRAKATTAEEIAQLDKDMPEFDEAQVAWINAEADRAENDESGKRKAETNAPEFTKEQKPYVDKLTAELAETKTKLAAADSKRAELEADLQKAQAGAKPIAGNLHPLALTDDPREIDAYEKGLEEFIAWGRANWDGSEAVEASGDTPAQPAYSAAQIRKAVTAREAELRKLIPAARETLKARQAEQAEARATYPATFDPQQPLGKVTEALLKDWPVLKAMQNHRLVIGDAIAGEQLRYAAFGDKDGPKISQDAAKTLLQAVPALGGLLPQLKAIAEGKVKTKAAKPGALRIPVRPPKGTPGAPSRVAVSKPAEKGPDVNKFIKLKDGPGGEMAALAEALG